MCIPCVLIYMHIKSVYQVKGRKCVILRISSDYFLKQHQVIGLCNGDIFFMRL
jgi:hypothetical protein